MPKRIIALIVAVAVIFAGSITALSINAVSLIKENRAEQEKKEKMQTSVIKELFHDQGYIYMTPDEPTVKQDVTIRLRAERFNVTRAQIQYTTDQGVNWNTVDMRYEKTDDTGYYDLWKGIIPAQSGLTHYRFIVSNLEYNGTVYYDTHGISFDEPASYNTCWSVLFGFRTPDWAKGTLWYSILPDAYFNGDTTNDKQISGENSYNTWNRLRNGLRDRYGGDLDGIIGKIEYIKDLNVDGVYVNPLQKSMQNAGYGTVDYNQIESAFGNEEKFAEFCKVMHNNNLKVMGDVVLSFSPVNSVYFNGSDIWPLKGASAQKDSAFAEFFKFYKWPGNYQIAWGNPAIDLGSSNIKNYLYADNNSPLKRYASMLDGYRFDCGGWLWGSTETVNTSSVEIVKDIRKHLKSVNSDFLILAESDKQNMDKYVWDSQWNLEFQEKLNDYAKGLINESLLYQSMYDTLYSYPRNVALCIENMISNHDGTRVSQNDNALYNASVLVQMTYLGAPVVYYGEEINLIRENEQGLGTTSSFYSMDWNQSNWDYSRLNFYRGISELRQKYSAVKTGVVNMLEVNSNDNYLAFARWDKKGAVITVASQNSDVKTIELNVAAADIADGTLLTDWFTGKSYKVSGGKVTVDVIPGGTAFVTGKNASSFRQDFEISKIGSTLSKSYVYNDYLNSFTVSGKGNFTKKRDAFVFANKQVFDDVAVSAYVKSGTAALMLRSDNSVNASYYAVSVNGSSITVTVRYNNSQAAREILKLKKNGEFYIKICRDAQNNFSAYTADYSDGKISSWELLDGSQSEISMPKAIKAGFISLGGKAYVNDVKITALGNKAEFDTFDGKAVSALFDKCDSVIENGWLQLEPDKNSGFNRLITAAPDDDWTFNARMEYIPSAKGDFAGVAAMQDDDNYVVAGRILSGNEQKLFIGKAVNGSVIIYDSVSDLKADEFVNIQIQRIGAYYSAVYSYDNGQTWQFIGGIYCNYSDESAGIIVNGGKNAKYDYVTFGNCINDGETLNFAQYPAETDLEYYSTAAANVNPQYRFMSGNWCYEAGGWLQKDTKAYAQASIVNNLYTDFVAEATIDIKDGDGWAGFAFGKASPDSSENDGFTLKYKKDGSLSLIKKGEKIAECTLKKQSNSSLRIVLECTGQHIVVYAGQNSTPVISVDKTGYYNGYISYVTYDASALFMNFNTTASSAKWNTFSGTVSGIGKSVSVSSTTDGEREIHGAVSLAGKAYTNLICTAKIAVNSKSEISSNGGILLSASEGKSAFEDGVYIGLNSENKLFVSVKGREVSAYPLSKSLGTADIMIVKQDKEFKVYLNHKSEPVIQYAAQNACGGSFTLYSVGSDTIFSNLSLVNIQPTDNYTENQNFVSWCSGYEIGGSEKQFNDSFDTVKSYENYVYYDTDSGTFSVENGVMRVTEASGYTAGATVGDGDYSDFTMQFKLRMDSSSGSWMSVGLRKAVPTGNHNNSGVSVMVRPDGTVFFFDSKTKTMFDSAKITDFVPGEWTDIKITANGSKIQLYCKNKLLLTYEDSSFYDGYISFASNRMLFSIDDLSIIRQ